MSDEPGTNLHGLQEYLDGRLSSERRAAFEARLESEPALRLELESALELRAALGEEGPELSPGFFARTRARFEESSRPTKGWSFRLLSWETAGVAAAAALATALFVPRLTQQGLPADLGAVATEKNQAVVVDVLKDEEPAFAPDPAEERTLREEEGWEEAPVGEMKQAALPAAPKAKLEKSRDRDMADIESERLESPGKQAPPPAPSSVKSDQRAGRDQELELSIQGSAAGETRHKRIALDDDALPTDAPTEAGGAERGQRSAVAARESRPVVVELPAGLIDREQLRSVERVEEWLALLGGSYGEAIEMLGPPAADRRLVLIGPRNGLVCNALTVTDDQHSHRIEWTRSPMQRAADGGCALVLPLDGRTVSIADPR